MSLLLAKLQNENYDTEASPFIFLFIRRVWTKGHGKNGVKGEKNWNDNGHIMCRSMRLSFRMREQFIMVYRIHHIKVLKPWPFNFFFILFFFTSIISHGWFGSLITYISARNTFGTLFIHRFLSFTSFVTIFCGRFTFSSHQFQWYFHLRSFFFHFSVRFTKIVLGKVFITIRIDGAEYVFVCVLSLPIDFQMENGHSSSQTHSEKRQTLCNKGNEKKVIKQVWHTHTHTHTYFLPKKTQNKTIDSQR